MITIMGIVVGLMVLATGQAYWVALLALVLAPTADAIARPESIACGPCWWPPTRFSPSC